MTEPAARPIPLLGDIALTAVQRVGQRIDGGFVDVPVLGLAGHAQQRSGRPSHRVEILGVLHGHGALDELAALQRLATSGEETTFAADIVTALDLQQVVVASFTASEVAGRPGIVDFALELVESPPLPPPAQLAGFGGLDDFGLGDLGFDTDIVGDLAGLAEEVAGAVDGALAAVDALGALAGLADFDFAGILEPVDAVSATVGDIGERLGRAASTLGEMFG
jgi:hypothetical protein